MTHQGVFILRLEFELFQRFTDDLGPIEDIFEDGRAEHEPLVFRVPRLMDNLHLLDDGRLARFA